MTITTYNFSNVAVGSAANDGTGDELRTAFIKLNTNFNYIQTYGFNAGNILTTGNIQATYFLGDGSQLTNLPGAYSNVQVATYLPSYSGSIGSLSVVGNLATSGARVETGLQIYKPAANIAAYANVNVNRMILAPTYTIIGIFGANVTLPQANVNGTVFSVTSNVATTLSVIPNAGTNLTPYGNIQLSAGTSAQYMYILADNTWYKIG
jgi:hypothetical protein